MSQIKLTADSGGGTTSLKAPSSTTSNADVVLKLPVADGSSGQVLKTDGSGQLSFGSDISDLVNDTSPQLGGTLDTNGQDITFNGAQNVSWDSSAADLIFNDYAKINLGTDKDFKMYQDGNNTILQSANTSGGVYLQGSLVQVGSETGEAGVKFTKDGAVEIYHDNAKKLETHAHGIRLNGAESGAQFQLGANADFQIEHDGSNSYIYNLTNDLVIQNDAAVEITAKSGGTKRFRFDSDGLKFGTDTAAANGLSDYEEGSWTPHVDGWDTYSPYSGASYNYNWYVKIGQLVHVGWKLYIQNLTTVSSDAHIRITGLPFAHQTYAAGPIGHIRFDIPEYGMSGYPLVYLAGSGTTLYMYKHVNGGNNLVAMNAAANRSNVWCMGTATYATS